MTDSSEPTPRSAPAEATATPSLAHRLEFAALRTVAGLVGLLGVDRASATMGAIWRLVAPRLSRHRRADEHLAAAMPELSAAERRAILVAMWDNLGRTAAETLLLPRLAADRSRFAVDTTALEPCREAIAKGAVFASLHMGNWEFCGWGIHLAGFRVAAVYQPMKNPLAEDFLRALREPLYDAGIFPRERMTPIRLRTLVRQGVAVGMLADLRDRSGIVAPFFGRPARLATFPAVLARRLGVPLIVGRVVRTDGARFRLDARPVEVPRTDDAEADIAEAALAMHAVFERWIAETPSQWMWAHRKWAFAKAPEADDGRD